jgi:hypothetical protein
MDRYLNHINLFQKHFINKNEKYQIENLFTELF